VYYDTSLLKAGTDQARRSAPCRAKRSRTLQARSVWTGYRAQTPNNAHEQAFANIIRLMSVHQRNLVVRARSIWTDFFMFVGFMQSLKFVSRFCILGPNKSINV
jgi:hypothetical protein